MKLLRWLFCIFFGRGLVEPKRTAEEIAQNLERAAKILQARKFIERFPFKEMTPQEVEALPVGCDKAFLETCPLGTWISCYPNEHVPDVKIVGQVVDGMDLYANQYGSGIMSLPERGINRYRLKTI